LDPSTSSTSYLSQLCEGKGALLTFSPLGAHRSAAILSVLRGQHCIELFPLIWFLSRLPLPALMLT
jgi:hypothetical protein